MKQDIKIVLDPFLIKIIDDDACAKHTYRSDIIAELISKEYGIKLNEKHLVNEETKKEYLISCIDNKSASLTAKKQEIMEEII